MQLDRKRHCHASSWTFALRNFILSGQYVWFIVRVIVVVVFDNELFHINSRSCRVELFGSAGASSGAFVIHYFEVAVWGRVLRYGYEQLQFRSSSELCLSSSATIVLQGVWRYCNVMTPCWVGFFHFHQSSCSMGQVQGRLNAFPSGRSICKKSRSKCMYFLRWNTGSWHHEEGGRLFGQGEQLFCKLG